MGIACAGEVHKACGRSRSPAKNSRLENRGLGQVGIRGSDRLAIEVARGKTQLPVALKLNHNSVVEIARESSLCAGNGEKSDGRRRWEFAFTSLPFAPTHAMGSPDRFGVSLPL